MTGASPLPSMPRVAWWRTLAVGLAAALLAGSELEAITPWHWQRLPVGDWAVAEGGAVCARCDGPSATYHNPAGLTRLSQPTISGSAQVIEYTRIATRAEGGVAIADELQLKPNSIGFASGGRELAWSLLLASPLAWNAAMEMRTQSGAGRRRDDARSSLEFMVGGLGLGLAGSSFGRLGLSLEVWLVSYRHDAGSSLQEADRALSASLSEWGRQGALRAALGWQQTRGDWQWGVLLRSPGWAVFNDGAVRSTHLAVDRSGATLSAIDTACEFAVPLPAQAVLGLAWLPSALPGFELEADLALHAGSAERQVFPALAGSTQRVGASAAPFFVPARTLDLRAIASPRGGLRYRLPDDALGWPLTLHAGGWIEPTPVDRSTVFTALDLLGGSLGASTERGPLRFTLCVSYLTNGTLRDAIGYLRTPQAGFAPSLADPAAEVAVRSFLLTLASVYRF